MTKSEIKNNGIDIICKSIKWNNTLNSDITADEVMNMIDVLYTKNSQEIEKYLHEFEIKNRIVLPCKRNLAEYIAEKLNNG